MEPVVGLPRSGEDYQEHVAGADPDVSYRGAPCTLAEDPKDRSITQTTADMKKGFGFVELFVVLCPIYWNMLDQLRETMPMVTT